MNFDWIADLVAKFAVPIVLIVCGYCIWQAMKGKFGGKGQ